MPSDKPIPKEIPDRIVDPASGHVYKKGKFLGKGGFARCFELVASATGEVSAGKVVSKSLLQKKHQKDKMSQEIAIHRSLNHEHVVGFKAFFEDPDNVYILLEICNRRSLMELHKRRRAVTEPEARYFTIQIISGVDYLHNHAKVIHRDLKLGNLFLNDEISIKIGDFGLATRVDSDDERKKTLCGTPNYIAPEMLNKKGHSFEVDIWAIGCILYTLLVGKPPFETQSLKDTYARIKRNEYHTPSRISHPAKELIRDLLAAEPSARPSIARLKNPNSYAFFDAWTPSRLPVSCLTMAPRFPNAMPPARRALGQVQMETHAGQVLSPKEQVARDLAGQARHLGSLPENGAMPLPSRGSERDFKDSMPPDFYLRDLYQLLDGLIQSGRAEKREGELDGEDAEDPACHPVYWVGKWVDYSDKYGLGYSLSDNSVGVLFNDTTKLILDSAGEQIQYIEKEGTEAFYTINSFPEELKKKVTLLQYFRNYMNDHLLKAGAHMAPREGDELARLPCLRTWFRTKSAIILHLTNGTLQVNFFGDHCKMILCPLMQAVTVIDGNRGFRTFRLNLLQQFGASKDLFSRLRYARTMVERLLNHSSSSARAGGSSSASSRSTAPINPAPNHGLRRQATGLPEFQGGYP